jgi:ketose-bisphosphate aldolase
MKTLREVLQEAERSGVAIGHFNFSELVVLKAVTESARDLNVPVLVGVSESEREFIGVRQVAALVRSIRHQYDFPIYLNADHTHSLPKAVEAAGAAFDAIVFDASALPFEDNVRETREAVEAIRAINPSIIVEGELGYIGSGSEIHTKAPEGLALTRPEEAKQFVDATGVDVLAPAVGNMHGLLQSMVRGEAEKRLDIERIRQIKDATRVFLTLHGGSGTNNEDFRKAIQAGINVIHVNTELRVAWRRGLEAGLAKQPDEIAPYKIFSEALAKVKEVVRARLQLFSSARNLRAGG